jgi:hypothetical protein
LFLFALFVLFFEEEALHLFFFFFKNFPLFKNQKSSISDEIDEEETKAKSKNKASNVN